ncbi:hypothetical protein Tco_0023488, partial [Tanacetum coccineum]
KKGKKLVKKELIVALRGELYFVKFIINPEEDDFEPGVILGRSFLRLAKGVIDFDIGPSLSAGGHLTQEEAVKEALAIRISQKFALLEEERPVIETMAYHDKYKKILNEIWKDKVELDGKTMKEDEEAVKRIKGEALKDKDDPSAFIFPIKSEGKVNENALADTGSDINTMPYRIYETLGGEDMKKIDRGITMINHTQAEAMGKLSNATKEALAIRISQRYALLVEERPVIETMAYHDKYKKILDEIWKDKVELDGKTVKEDEEAVKRIKGEALKEKDDPSAFIFPIRSEGKVNENALADTGSDINTMPYRIYETLG